MTRWVQSVPLVVLAYLAGCVSQIPTPERFADGYLGLPIDRLLRAVMRPGSYAHRRTDLQPYTARPLADGHDLYVIPYGPGCTMHVEADETGLISDIRFLGACY